MYSDILEQHTPSSLRLYEAGVALHTDLKVSHRSEGSRLLEWESVT